MIITWRVHLIKYCYRFVKHEICQVLTYEFYPCIEYNIITDNEEILMGDKKLKQNMTFAFPEIFHCCQKKTQLKLLFIRI